MADTLSRKKTYHMATLLTGQKLFLEDLVKLEVELITERVEACLSSMSLQPTLTNQKREKVK